MSARKTQTGNARVRRALLVLWLAFFVQNVLCALYLYLDDWIEADNFRALMTQLNSSYATYLGMMVTFYIASSKQKETPAKPITAMCVVAFSSSVLWNLIISAFVIRLVLLRGSVEDSVEQISFFIPLLSWIVAPAIGLYFAQDITSKDEGSPS